MEAFQKLICGSSSHMWVERHDVPIKHWSALFQMELPFTQRAMNARLIASVVMFVLLH